VKLWSIESGVRRIRGIYAQTGSNSGKITQGHY